MSRKHFIHYNPATGEIIAITDEDEVFFEARLDRGENVLEVPDTINSFDYCLDLETLELLPKPPDDPAIARAENLALEIRGALIQSDHYFTGDALDNITAEEQAAWRAYRVALRTAAESGDVRDIPACDPKGTDRFASMRGSNQ
jgi:hypothetical protein